jgi:2-methylisocitrate lyase-like PEP mutase family enzyme
MPANTFTQTEKAKQLYDLHHANKLLILPNIWNVLGAKLLQDIGYNAIATASASIAYSNGFKDGEIISFTQVLSILKSIAASVNVPVTADIESGYANDENELAQNIRQLIEAGIVGINIEDTNKKTYSLLSAEEQCKKIELIKNIATDMNVQLFINARTDCFIHAKNFSSPEQKLQETINRGLAYKQAGADCFYPILMNDENEIRAVVKQVAMPVNIIVMPGIPSLKILHETGVARVSLGPGFLKYAMQAMKNIALKLQHEEGVDDIINNDITSEYLQHLVAE